MRVRASTAGFVLMMSVLVTGRGGAEPLTDQVLRTPPVTIGTAQSNLNFELVGQHGLRTRGNNAAIALAGNCVYVGNRGFDSERVYIVDVTNPATPFDAGFVTDTALTGATTREVRTSPSNHLLVIMTYGPLGSRNGLNALRLYDISDCRRPALRGILDLGLIRPHEFFLWEDPVRPGRVIAYVTTPFGPPQLVVADLSNPSAPALVTAWEGLYPQPVGAEAENSFLASYLHSLSISPDGRRGYLAYWDAGYYEIDTSLIADAFPRPVIVAVTPVKQAAGMGVGYAFRANADDPDPVRLVNKGNTHSAVPLPDRGTSRYVALTDEAYDAVGECPYGWFHLVDATNPLNPAIVSEYKLEQNTVEWCDDPANIVNPRDDTYLVSPYSTHEATWSAHNLTTTDNLAFVAWHAGGLQVVDTSNPASLAQAGSFIPTPLPCILGCSRPRPAELGEFLGSHPVLMWSYPIISNGLIYVLDIRNGLYILRYTGPHAAEVNAIGLREGNSNVTSRTIVPAGQAGAASAVRTVSLGLGTGAEPPVYFCELP